MRTTSRALWRRLGHDWGTGRGCHPREGAVETFVRREEAERFIEEVRGDDPELAGYLLIEGAGTRGRWAELAARACSETCRAYLCSLATSRGPI